MKIALSENQLNMIKNTLNESSDGEYSRQVDVKIYSFRANYKGKEINDITINDPMELSFLIDMEVRNWGVKSVSLYAISGPETISVKVDYYISDMETETEDVDIKLDWDKLETEEKSGTGIITVGDELEINLINDENGDLVLGKMVIETYSL